ncbi:MAG: DUF4271 domain-containing protein [Paludibacter sp.]|nr:DUF4271 domain-containing protein [Paludibacter sp.]MBP8783612.1 DUF4271 domain-containing protein [Paludibacter sp.]
MPLNDSIHILSDSALFADSLLRADSLQRADSIMRVDSIMRADSIALADSLRLAKLSRGFEGIPHPSFPESESWVFGTILFLFLMMVVSFLRSSGWFYESVRIFFQVKDRSSIFSKTTINDFQSRFILILFSVGVLSLYGYILLIPSGKPFEITQYALVLGVTLLFYIFKFLSIEVLGYVFLEKQSLKIARESYFNLLIYLGIVLFPLLIFQIYFPLWLNDYTVYISLVVCVLLFVFLIFKLFQIFFQKAVTSFYLLLYLCTLEILPVFLIYSIIRTII